MNRPRWHKSSFSDGGSNCVEVREHVSGADVRDTQHRNDAELTFPAAEWHGFLTQFKHQAL
ncbi:protein of unknown function [Nocardiopsis flavescens]|uniref:DUF397 domain-containing protein n=1 Tax=Nocardiopsis flavescens TaxID=758803 RepID=A0A1M6IRN3_9ACTN|nr:DUF397 domain-containing protein [Nocardiopsis flavescens]SHJ37028.1 protein of unknown function [Nocardiopsis flavescens]